MSSAKHTPIRMWTIVEENYGGVLPWMGLYDTKEDALRTLVAETADTLGIDEDELELFIVDHFETAKGECVSYQADGDSAITWTIVGHR